jgi:putative transcriptional regulator
VKLSEVKRRIAGGFVYDKDFSSALKRWRKTFRISQTELAKQLKISPSVLSDYEKGRRKSPGIKTVMRIIDALVEIDSARSSPVTNTLSMLKSAEKSDGIIRMVEFSRPVKIHLFCDKIGAKMVVDFPFSIYGCTVIDAKKAIVGMSAEEFIQFFGEFPERAFIFTNVRSGKPVMVAVKVGRLYAKMLKPRLIVLHMPTCVSETAIKIAESEKIALATTEMPLDRLLNKIGN